MRRIAWVLLLLSVGAAAETQVRVGRVEIAGVSSLDLSVLEGALEISAGDTLDRVRMVRSGENLQRVFRLRGYEEVQVRTELKVEKGMDGNRENVLVFKIQEGRPSRIASVEVELASTKGMDARSASALRSSLLSRAGLSPGDVFDQEKIGDARRALIEAMTARERVGVRVDQVRVVVSEAPKGIANGILENTFRWVALTFVCDPGEQVTFGFLGNKTLTRSELIKIVDEQRTLGFGKDYVLVIQSRIVEAYQALGFNRVSVIPYPQQGSRNDERHVTYEIQEGPRIEIDRIEFEGNNSFSPKELREAFLEGASRLVQNGYFVEKDVDAAGEKLIEWLKSRGYLGARLISIQKTQGLGHPNRVDLLVYLYEGDQTRVRSVTLNGVTVFEREEILETLGTQPGVPLNLFAFSEGMEKLKSRYRERGYLEVQIVNEESDFVVRYSQENRVADILIEIDEGYEYRASDIRIDGTIKTHPMVVRRELRFGIGDVLEEKKIQESEARLRRLGIFSNVQFNLEEDSAKPGHKIVNIKIEEAMRMLIATGVGFRNDLGVRLFAQGSYSNIGRRNHTISLDATTNRRILREYCLKQCFIEYEAGLNYLWPYFLLDEMTFRPRFSAQKVKYFRFSATSLAMALTWEKPLFEEFPLKGIFTYSLERILQFDADDAVDEQGLRIGAVIPSLLLDFRDSPLAPTEGWMAQVTYELADPNLLSQRAPFPIGYTRTQFRADYFLPITRGIRSFFSFRTGFQRSTQAPSNPAAPNPDDPRGQIPLIKRFSLGGVGSLRGFQEQELNLQSTALFGTASFVNYRAQVDFPFFADLTLGPFLDAANLNVDRFSFGDLRYGAGFGVRYFTPIGPVNFDWGFKVEPRPGEDPYRFYFSIGVI